MGGPFGGNNSPEYQVLNPNGLVPTIVEDNFVLWESNSIVRYLAHEHGHGVLWPAYGNHMEEINQTALEAGLGRDGRYDYVYDTSHFYERGLIREQFEKINEGSLALKLNGIG